MPTQNDTALPVRDRFIRRLENSILSGELAVGQRLPSERELAEQMDISKTAIHDGITEMVRKGFLEVVPRQGIFVGDYARNGTLDALQSIMRYDGGRLDRRNMRSLMEMRSAVEGLALELVIRAADPALPLRLREILAQAEDIAAHAGAGDRQEAVRELAETCFLFHHTICVSSGNTLAPLIFNAFHAPSVSIWEMSVNGLGMEETLDRLRVFIRAIEAGDLEGSLRHLDYITSRSGGLAGL